MMKVDWLYFRKGWTSCKKAQEFLGKDEVLVETTINANKEKFDLDAAWELLKNAQSITTARGKKIERWNPQSDDKETILKKVMGPSGNLRAPTFRLGNDFFVGFNPELYQEHFE